MSDLQYKLGNISSNYPLSVDQQVTREQHNYVKSELRRTRIGQLVKYAPITISTIRTFDTFFPTQADETFGAALFSALFVSAVYGVPSLIGGWLLKRSFVGSTYKTSELKDTLTMIESRSSYVDVTRPGRTSSQ